MKSNIFVFDTNSLISAFLLPQSVSMQALNLAIRKGEVAVSNDTLDEFTEVLFRRKFDKYFTPEERWVIVEKITRNTIVFFPTELIFDCRDPKDNKFLELAVSANASCIITGDNDLLVLHPYRNIAIINAFNFLNHFTV